MPMIYCAAIQRIEFARTKSDAIAKLDGSYKPDKERSKKSAAARGEWHCCCDSCGAALAAATAVQAQASPDVVAPSKHCIQ
jgi:hypothetical protein